MAADTRTLARPAAERFSKLHNAFQVLKDINHVLPSI
jgi:hypothetical protein